MKITMLLTAGALAVAAAVSLTGCANDAALSRADAATPAASRPPIVLVHGAWMGAWSWQAVADDLRGRGYPVTVVELPGHGADATPPEKLSLDDYVKAVEAQLPAGRPAVLVGHSMAGMVISGVAQDTPTRVSRLVYVAGYLPRSGESLYQLSSTDADSHVGRFWRQADPKNYSPATIAPEGIVDVFCADCAPAEREQLVARHRAEALPPLGTPLTLTADRFGTVPRTYIHTLRDNAVSYPLQKRMVANAGPGTTELEIDTSHSPMLSRPKALADLIAGAAR